MDPKKEKNPRPLNQETEGKPFAVPLLLMRSYTIDPLEAGNGGCRPERLLAFGMLRNEFGKCGRCLAAYGSSLKTTIFA